MEIWKSIENSFYEVSNLGNVRSIDHFTEQNDKGKTVKVFHKGTPISQHTRKVGYQYVNLYLQGKLSPKNVHRLVATAFIPNPDNLPQVNHIDGNKANNCVDNLEWSLASDNVKHAYETGLHSSLQTEAQIKQYEDFREAGREYCKSVRKPIRCAETGIVYTSARDCAEKTGLDRHSLMRCVKKQANTVGGFHWEYV